MNGVTGDSSAVHHAPVDGQIDPSIATAITTGHPGAGSDSVPAYTSNAANGEASSGPVVAAPEKAAEVPTTTTTTIITTTTGAPSANGMSPTSPLSPTSGGESAPVSALANSAPVANGVPAEGAPTTTQNAVAPAAVGAAGGAVAGAAVAGAATEEKQPEMVLKPKEAKKYEKLLKKEAKNDEHDLANAIKDAQNLEKPLRKATKAEQQSQKRHQSAVHDEHKASKSFNKAKLEYEKAQAALQKALDELDIKKKHTTATQEAFDQAKQRIDSLRNQKVENDKDRARRQASLTTTA